MLKIKIMRTLFIKIILSLALLIPCTVNLSAEDTNHIKEEQIIFLLKKHCPYNDPNPIWQEDADEVNVMFLRVIDGFKKYTERRKRNLRTKVFSLLYANSTAIFEDAVDVNRMATRRCLCFMTLAMLSHEYKFGVFIEDAVNSISTIPDYQPQEIALIKLLEILIINNFKDTASYSIEKKPEDLYDFFNANKDYFTQDFVDDFSILIRE